MLRSLLPRGTAPFASDHLVNHISQGQKLTVDVGRGNTETCVAVIRHGDNATVRREVIHCNAPFQQKIGHNVVQYFLDDDKQ